MSWSEKLKKRWGLKSSWQVLAILIVFASTGMTSLYVKEGLYFIAGIDQETPKWVRIIYRIFATFIAYQFLLLAFGWIFGQFHFFWGFEKRMLSRFSPKKNKDQSGDGDAESV